MMEREITGPFTVSDHTAVVAFCLSKAELLAADASNSSAVLRHAADLADGRIRTVLATASRHRDPEVEPTVEGLRIGLRTAQGLLEDGAQRIYRPAYWHEEGMLVVGSSATDADERQASESAIAELAYAGASAALQAGWRHGKSTQTEAVHEAILAAIVASVPIAIVLAHGAHHQ